MKQTGKCQKGQTLIEVVFVLLILLSVIAILLSSYIYSFRAEGADYHHSIAAQFAREGMETVRGIRDSNWLDSNKDWKDGLFPASNPSNIDQARIDWRPAEGTPYLNFSIDSITGAQIYLHDLNFNNFFNYDPQDGQPTGFYRLVEMEKICDPINFPPQAPCLGPEVIGFKVTVKMQWQGGQPGQVSKYELVDYLYNWR